MPASRLPLSIQDDLSIPIADPPDTSTATTTTTAVTPAAPSQPTPSIVTPSTSGPSRQRGLSVSVNRPSRPVSPSTLRKSYRRVLALSSGLRVRMRTLFLPQLLPPSQDQESHHDNEHDGEHERRVALCVEVENPQDRNGEFAFEIDNVAVDVGGKGGKASAELLCQPEQTAAFGAISASANGGAGVFPLRLEPVEQYNLLYAVTIATVPEDGSGPGIEENMARSMGQGDAQRPVAIIVSGRPFTRTSPTASSQSDVSYPTASFQSRWNCALDLAPFYASISAGNVPPPPIVPDSAKNRNSKTIQASPNAIAGDKRYSLATMLSNRPSSYAGPSIQRPVVTSQSRGGMPPIASRTTSITSQPGSRVPSFIAQKEHHGLLISVKVLPPEQFGSVVQLEPFSIEVFVHNRTEEVRRFRLSVPGREVNGKVREAWEKRRRRGPDEPPWGTDEPGTPDRPHERRDK